jgi:hypothetical protein
MNVYLPKAEHGISTFVPRTYHVVIFYIPLWLVLVGFHTAVTGLRPDAWDRRGLYIILAADWPIPLNLGPRAP